MRLICPNCGAQYEVPDEVIPAAGRDVQCSNCGDTWFQHHPDHAPASVDDDADTYEAPATSDETPAAETVEGEDAVEDAEQSGPRRLDPAVADVLREEAEREQQARAADSDSGLETQPDLGLEDNDERTRQARARMARLRGQPEEDGAEKQPQEEIDPGSRRNLLPDIEEINSSLESNSGRRDPGLTSAQANAASTEAETGSGFRQGFLLAIVIALVLLLLYRFAPVIAARIPGTEAAMAGYVDTINAARATLSALVSDMLNGN